MIKLIKLHLPLLLIASSTLMLCACTSLSPKDKRAGVCNELNSQIIFNGGTSNTRTAEIEQSETPLAQRNYHDHQCDQQ